MAFKAFNSGFTGKNYDSYQPDGYDPSIMRANNADGGAAIDGGAYTTAAAKPGQKMQINLTITNATASVLTAELFQYLDSVTRRLKSEYATGTYLMIPQDSYEGLRRVVANTGGVVGWDQEGNLVYRGNDTTPDPLFTIGCSEVAYRSLFDASAVLPFQVTYIRQTVETQAQFDRKIVWFKRTIAGGEKVNGILPRAYFRPNQYQSLTVDIPITFDVNIDSGIRLPVIAGEVVVLNLFISFWTYQDLV